MNYQKGVIDTSSFKKSLQKNDVEISRELSVLIRKSNAGNQLTYQAFGTEIFKQIDKDVVQRPINPALAEIKYTKTISEMKKINSSFEKSRNLITHNGQN